MRHLVNSVSFSWVQMVFLLTTTLHYSVRTILIYNDTKYGVPFMALKLSSTVHSESSLHRPVGYGCVGE